MPTRKKKKYSKFKSVKKSKEPKNNKQNENRFIKTLIIAKRYTEEIDPKYNSFKTKPEFKDLVKNNPTLYIVNMVMYDCFKKSLFDELCQVKNKELASVLKYCFKLATIVNTKTKSEKYPIITQLCNQGFNTIYDIILENTESFFLVSFASHLSTEGIIKEPNEFVKNLSKNKLYEMLRDKLVIKGLQLVDLFTRIKRYQ
tara:strand:- start:1067 stop:1666 length:600 start_codon:yes stop_codon:yes gene_type:complete